MLTLWNGVRWPYKRGRDGGGSPPRCAGVDALATVNAAGRAARLVKSVKSVAVEGAAVVEVLVALGDLDESLADFHVCLSSCSAS